MRKLALLLTLVVAILAVACGGGSKPENTDQNKAFQAALGYVGDDPANPPPLGTQFKCSITVALQPPSPQPTLRPVIANCLWNVKQQGSVWIATFNETWRCDDFSSSSTKYPACVPPVGFHEWQYQIDLRQGRVIEQSSKGQFAPDMRK